MNSQIFKGLAFVFNKANHGHKVKALTTKVNLALNNFNYILIMSMNREPIFNRAQETTVQSVIPEQFARNAETVAAPVVDRRASPQANRQAKAAAAPAKLPAGVKRFEAPQRDAFGITKGGGGGGGGGGIGERTGEVKEVTGERSPRAVG
jgi:hypothetical protein